MRTNNTSITNTTITYPDLRVFAFSPNKATVTTSAVNDVITVSWVANGINQSLKRYTGVGNTVDIPLMYIFKSFFAGTEIGDVLPVSSNYANTASKLFLTGKTISIEKGGQTAVLTFDVIWGALQIGEVESSVEEIYTFGTLPVLLTQNIGNYVNDNDGSSIDTNNYGKDMYVNSIISTYPSIDTIRFQTLPSTTHKTYNIIKSTCENGIFLRWVDRIGNYKQFLFMHGASNQESKAGESFTKELLTTDATSSGLYKGQSQLIDISGNNVDLCSVVTATYNQQKYIQSLETSIKAWKYLGANKWVEVTVKMNPIKIDERFQQNQSIELEVISPNLYLQSL